MFLLTDLFYMCAIVYMYILGQASVRPWIEAKRFPSSHVFDLLQFTHVACGL